MPTFTYPTDFAGTLWRILDGDIYVSYNGHDAPGNGTPTKPYATIQYAIDAATADQKIVVGTGDYNENVNGGDKDCFLIADGTVEMDGTDPGGAAFTNMGPSAIVSGFKILKYDSCTDDPMLRFEDCFITSDVTAAVTSLQRCVLKDNEITGAVTDFLNCTFINVDKQTQTSGVTVENCHFDPATIFSLISSAVLFFDNCNQESGSTIKIDGVSYSSAAAVNTALSQFQGNGMSTAPSFNGPLRNDYTLRLGSPLIQTGTHSQPIGAFSLASSWDKGNLGGVILNKIIIDNDGYFTLPEEVDEGSLETPKPLDLGQVRTLGRVDLFADQYFSPDFFGSVTFNQDTINAPRPITFLLRYHNNDRDIFKTEYKEFIWDKILTVDSSNRGNGDPKFNPLTERYITARFVQVKIVLRHTSESFFIAQENSDLILQEDGGKLKLENA